MHDLLLSAGYGRDPLGEASLTAFSFAQTGLKGFAMIAIVGSHRGFPVHCRANRFAARFLKATVEGDRASWLVGADWENLLAEPSKQIRARYGIYPPAYYPKAIASTRVAAGGRAKRRYSLNGPERRGPAMTNGTGVVNSARGRSSNRRCRAVPPSPDAAARRTRHPGPRLS